MEFNGAAGAQCCVPLVFLRDAPLWAVADSLIVSSRENENISASSGIHSSLLRQFPPIRLLSVPALCR